MCTCSIKPCWDYDMLGGYKIINFQSGMNLYWVTFFLFGKYFSQLNWISTTSLWLTGISYFVTQQTKFWVYKIFSDENLNNPIVCIQINWRSSLFSGHTTIHINHIHKKCHCLYFTRMKRYFVSYTCPRWLNNNSSFLPNKRRQMNINFCNHKL